MTLQNSFVRIAQRLVGLGLAFAFLASVKVAAANGGKTFPTPQAAVDALAAAVNAKDRQALRTLFGLATDELVAADKVQAENELTEFTAAFNQSNRIVPESDSKCYLEVGSHRWPFPIPLAKRDGGWFFDTEAGKEELLNRRIGKNELATLQTIRAYVDAQRAYASRDRDNDGVLEYAQKLLSSPGRKNGLFWPPDLDGEISPLGPLVAYGQTEGYALRPTDANPSPRPFHGYYYRMLTRQGNHAPGGKYNYIINGNMIGGFALVAYPANYGESGIMTFIVNQQGVVYQRDLGAKTARSAAAMKAYDPDSTWLASPD